MKIVHTKHKLIRKPEIDLGLDVIETVRGSQPMNCEDIAAVCGCSRQRIDQIMREALRKLRAAAITRRS